MTTTTAAAAAAATVVALETAKNANLQSNAIILCYVAKQITNIIMVKLARNPGERERALKRTCAVYSS